MSATNPTTFRHALTTRLAFLGWTQGHLGSVIGLSNAVISRQIRLRAPSPGILERVAHAVGLPLDSLKDLDRQLDPHPRGWDSWTMVVHEGSEKAPQPHPELRCIITAFAATYTPSKHDSRWKSPLTPEPVQPRVGDVVVRGDEVILCEDPSDFDGAYIVYRDVAA
jgi:hypothetical protein